MLLQNPSFFFWLFVMHESFAKRTPKPSYAASLFLVSLNNVKDFSQANSFCDNYPNFTI
jgi:hypothetical protein